MSRRSSPGSRPDVLLGVLAVAGSFAAVKSGRADPVDAGVGRALATPRGPTVDRLVGVTTDLGSIYGLGGAVAALAAGGHPQRAVRLTAAGLTAWTVAQAAKPLVRRPRPYQDALADRLVAEPAGSSWPSGHTAVIVAMGLTLAPGMPRPARLAVGAVTTGVACSRLYVGVHHPSDLVAGAGIGVLATRLSRALVPRIRRRYETDSGSGRPTIER